MTLNLIHVRKDTHGVILNLKIRRSASTNRRNLLNALIKRGAWDELKALRAKLQIRYGRLRDYMGHGHSQTTWNQLNKA